MKKIYTVEMKDFILANYKDLTIKELTEIFNNRFNTNITEKAMKSYKSNHKLKSSRKGLYKGTKYNREITDYILNNYKDKSCKALAEEVNTIYGTNFDNDSISNFKSRLQRLNIDIRTGINEGCYHKGNIPLNKGTKGMYNVGGNKTSFKKGNKAYNCDPIGTEKWKVSGTHPDDIGFLYVKVADGKKQHNWKQKHRLIWEEANGPISGSHKVIFADGDRTHIELSNLILVSNSEMLIMNRNNLIYDDVESTVSGSLVAKLIDKTNKSKLTHKKRGDTNVKKN